MMGGANAPEYLIKDGIRLDGRKPEDMRPVKIEAGVLSNADGSAYIEVGKTKAIAGVFGPRPIHPRHDTLFDRARVRCLYTLNSFSTEDRARPGPSRRSKEISKVSSEALSAAVVTERFPRTAIDVFVHILQADGSTRVSGLTAASVALADAGIPMYDMVTSLAFGKIYGIEDGKKIEKVVLDVDKPEDNYGRADVATAVLPNLGQTVLMQMDGNLTYDQFQEGLKLRQKGVDYLYKLQVEALKRRYE